MFEYIALLLARSQLASQSRCPEVKSTSNPYSRTLPLHSAPKAVTFEPHVSSSLLQQSVLYSPVPTEGENEELILAGHHDLPAELQDQMTAPHQAEQDDDFYIKMEFRQVRHESGPDGLKKCKSLGVMFRQGQ